MSRRSSNNLGRGSDRGLPSPPGRGSGGEGKTKVPPQLLTFARRLRKEQTSAENLIWALLRNRRFMGRKFRRQHPVDGYILDFHCHEERLAIELDGSQHGEADTVAHDVVRTKALRRKGIRLLRFWNNDILVRTESVLQGIFTALTPALSRGEREDGG